MDISATAFHEAGHAVANYLNHEPAGTVSIIPDGISSGHFKPERLEIKKILEVKSFQDSEEVQTNPPIDYENLAECILAGEAALVICGVQDAPDWENSGYHDWCQAHACLFKRLDIPFDEEEPAFKVVPEAFKLLKTFDSELVLLYFDFVFRRVSLKLKHNWSLVEAVAIALTQRKQLNAEELSDVIKAATRICGRCERTLDARSVTCEECDIRFCSECAAVEIRNGLCSECAGLNFGV
jgi:hypothetical protein